MPPCAMPGCDGQMPLGARRCSMWSCEEVIHHACCADWYHEQGLPDPPNNSAYCWTCIQKLFPHRFGRDPSDDNDDDGGLNGSSRAESSNVDKRRV